VPVRRSTRMRESGLRLSKFIPDEFVSNWEFEPDLTDPPSIKKARYCGLFLWMARLERFELPTARFVALLVK
jgi:hypothetical protein